MLRVVRGVVGIQSQVPTAAALSLWARVEGLALRDIEREVETTRRLARTWAFRGTVHLLARDDVPLVAAALGREVGGFEAYVMRSGLLTEELYVRMRAAILEALEDGPQGRTELKRIVGAKVPESEKLFGSWGGVMRILAHEGLTVFGPRRGPETTFARVDRWWAETDPAPPPEEPLAGLLRRYLRAYAPARLTDFAYWSGVTVERARLAARALGAQLAETSLEGRSAWVLEADMRALRRAEAAPGVRLLPHFDTSLLAHRDKAHLVDPPFRKRVFRNAGWISPTILVNGRVEGTWSSERRGSRLYVKLSPFGSLARPVRAAIRGEAASLARFLEASDVSLSG